MAKTVIVRGERVKVIKSPRKNKQLRAEFPSGDTVDFGDPRMPEYPGTKRGDNYCARSSGIKGTDDPMSPNFWSRKYLWNCQGKKSLKTRRLR